MNAQKHFEEHTYAGENNRTMILREHLKQDKCIIDKFYDKVSDKGLRYMIKHVDEGPISSIFFGGEDDPDKAARGQSDKDAAAVSKAIEACWNV
jgi:hypothetical protein